jgi:hypothetical protein
MDTKEIVRILKTAANMTFESKDGRLYGNGAINRCLECRNEKMIQEEYCNVFHPKMAKLLESLPWEKTVRSPRNPRIEEYPDKNGQYITMLDCNEHEVLINSYKNGRWSLYDRTHIKWWMPVPTDIEKYLNKQTLKELYWTSGNVLKTKGDIQSEYYVIKDDDKAYPCNKKIDEWWSLLSEDMYDDNLESLKEDNVREFWNIISVYVPLKEPLSIEQWVDGNIMKTKGELFFSFSGDKARELNNGGAFLEKTDYADDLSLRERPYRSWSIDTVYKEIKLEKSAPAQ